MFKERKTNTVLLGLVAILIISPATAMAEEGLDIDGIFMTSCMSPGDPSDWVFEFWVTLENPGSLHHIDVTLPAGGLPAFSIYEDPYCGWEYDSPLDYPSLSALREDYPTGTYTLDFCDSMDTVLRSVTLDYSSLPGEPLSHVDFTYPSYDGQTGITYIYPAFSWTVDTGAGDALAMWLSDGVTDELIYENVPVSTTTNTWSPGSLQPNHYYDLTVSVFNAKDLGIGPTLPTMNIGGDTFEYCLMIEYLNEITFTTAPAGTLSGWVWVEESSDYGYSLSENDLVYFVSFGPVWNYNFTTGEWAEEGTVGWIFADWPFFYDLAKNSLMFALPPESGLWVYHFSTDQWELLPRIIPW